MAYRTWVVEVLDDIIAFAKEEGLPETQRALLDARDTVDAEIRRASSGSEPTSPLFTVIHAKNL